jgi:hypothetical protein
MVVELVAALVALVVAVAGVLVGARLPWRVAVRKRVVVVLVDGESMQGVLLRRSGPLLVLSGAAVQSPAGAVPMDGVVVVERSRVSWVQVVG